MVLDYLSALNEHNDRSWFQANKTLYDQAKKEMEEFVAILIPAIAGFDPSVKHVEAKDCMFRIFRDVRFAKDKSPYKTNMGAWITAMGRRSSGPGYYLHLEPGKSFLAGGVYMPEPEKLKLIRKEIYYNPEEFLGLLEAKGAKRYFDGLSEDDKQKLAPRDFPRDFEYIDLLKYKHYTVSHPVGDEKIVQKQFLSYTVDVFKAMEPLNRFLRRAIAE